MKLTTTILILFVCFGCKVKEKKVADLTPRIAPVLIHDSAVSEKDYDSSIKIGGMVGQALIDKDGKTIDSIQGDLFYKCNYKYVPLGLYVDTTVWKEDRYDVVQIRVFLDRKKIFYTMFLNHPPEVWDADIDKEYLKSKLK
jgi:hypothetical protein